MLPLIKQYVEERRALRRTIYTTPVNEVAVRAQATRVAQVESDLEVKRAHVAERIGALLTPEQITKLKELASGVDASVDAAIERIVTKSRDP